MESVPLFAVQLLQMADATGSLTDIGLQLYLSALNSLMCEPPAYAAVELRSLLKNDLGDLADRLGVRVGDSQALDSIRGAITAKAASSEINSHILARFLSEKNQHCVDFFEHESLLMPGSLVWKKLRSMASSQL